MARCRIGNDVAQGRGLAGQSGDHDRVIQGPAFPQEADHACQRGGLLPDGRVDAQDAGVFLAENDVESESGLSDLAVSQDELPLAPAQRHQCVEQLDAGVERLEDRSPLHDPGRCGLDRPRPLRGDRTQTVEGPSQGIHHPPEERLADGDFQRAPGAFDPAPFLDVRIRAEQEAAHGVLEQVECNAIDAAREPHHFL